ncbi:hypothetical protein N0V85_008552 [Neurospora sp. IMI 360204]|nr:hypothetical protein N0V85_008552 [Neurospora sp. IMI 360204]
MRFSLISSILATLSSVAITAPTSQPGTTKLTTRDITIEDCVDFLETLSNKAQQLELIAEEITTINGPLITIDQGPFPEIIDGIDYFNDEADKFKTMYAESETVFDEVGCNIITASNMEFFGTNDAFLTTLIRKASLFHTVPVIGKPVYQALEQLGGRYSDLGKFLVGHRECESTAEFDSDFKGLSKSVTKAIYAYKGIAALTE